MDLKNTYAVMTVRILFGLTMAASGVFGLLTNPLASGNVPQEMVAITQAFMDSGIFSLAKVVESITGLMLIFNVMPALAVLMLVPLVLGILVIHTVALPSLIVPAIILAAVEAYLVYVYWNRYKAIFK